MNLYVGYGYGIFDNLRDQEIMDNQIMQRLFTESSYALGTSIKLFMTNLLIGIEK